MHEQLILDLIANDEFTLDPIEVTEGAHVDSQATLAIEIERIRMSKLRNGTRSRAHGPHFEDARIGNSAKRQVTFDQRQLDSFRQFVQYIAAAHSGVVGGCETSHDQMPHGFLMLGNFYLA